LLNNIHMRKLPGKSQQTVQGTLGIHLAKMGLYYSYTL
jgi:hypothetical protein